MNTITAPGSWQQKLVSTCLCVLLLAGTLPMSGCFTHEHIVGDGPQSGQIETERQWYILFGLIPLTDNADTSQLADGAEDYKITTEFTFVDLVIGFFTSIVTVQPRTVIVEQ